MNATSAISTVPASEPPPTLPAAKFLTFVLGPCFVILVLWVLLRGKSTSGNR